MLIGEEGLQRLSVSRVAVIGVGGVGGYAAEMVVRAGVGHLIIMDSDNVSVTNKNRQLLALDSTVGRPKCDVLRERLLDINPQLDIIVLKEYLEAEIRHSHLEDYISQILIPTEKVYTIRNGKKISKEKVSYPGYVLVEAAFVGQIPILIRNTPNVLGFLGDTKEDSRKMIATPLRPQEVARILGRVDEMNAMEEENEIPFFVGETVKVTDGPFSSFQGTIEAVDNERKKLTVSVKIFGRKTPMELSFTQVEKE